MKFYSELVDKLFDSVDELEAAEHQLKIEQIAEEKKKRAAQEEKKRRTDEIDQAYAEAEVKFKEYEDSLKRAVALFQDYLKDYGSFKKTVPIKEASSSGDLPNFLSTLLSF